MGWIQMYFQGPRHAQELPTVAWGFHQSKLYWRVTKRSYCWTTLILNKSQLVCQTTCERHHSQAEESSVSAENNSELSGHQTRCLLEIKHCTLPQTHHPHFKVCWWQRHASWHPPLKVHVKMEDKMNAIKYWKFLMDNLMPSSKNYDLGENLFSSKTMTRIKRQKWHKSVLKTTRLMFWSGWIKAPTQIQ